MSIRSRQPVTKSFEELPTFTLSQNADYLQLHSAIPKRLGRKHWVLNFRLTEKCEGTAHHPANPDYSNHPDHPALCRNHKSPQPLPPTPTPSTTVHMLPQSRTAAPHRSSPGKP